MSLAKRWESQFGSRVRVRGDDCFAAGRVHLIQVSATGAVATVDGAPQYAVLIDASQAESDGLVFARCECPRYFDGIWCKHVWATVRALDEQGVSLGNGARRFVLAFDGEPSEDPEPEGEDRSFEPHPQGDPPRGEWTRRLGELERTVASTAPLPGARSPEDARQILFHVDPGRCRARGELVVELFHRKRKKNGDWGKLRPATIDRHDVATFADEAERELLELLLSLAASDSLHRGWGVWGEPKVASTSVPAALYRVVLPRLSATGRLHWKAGAEDEAPPPIGWDDAPAYRLKLKVARDGRRKATTLIACLSRDDEERSLSEVVLVLPSGLLFFADRLALLEDPADVSWLSFFRERDSISVPAEETPALIERLFRLPSHPKIELAPELEVRHVEVRPTPWIRFQRPDPWDSALMAELVFDYQGTPVEAGDSRHGVLKGRSWLKRDFDFEEERKRLLVKVGFDALPGHRSLWTLDADRFHAAASRLIAEGFLVFAEGRRVRAPQSTALWVSSGIDWLDLEGGIDFGGEIVSVPQILAKLAEGQRFVRLGDGSHGMLPEEWLERAGLLMALSPERREKALRFRPFQALLLDALLESEKSFRPDEGFVRLRERLRSFQGIAPQAPPAGFRGELRDYQKEGLAWLSFLEEYGFGGCLADDMGLGKTIQVLAFLEAQRERSNGHPKPSLVVVPRSLVHNWLQEAARFVPDLRIREYGGGKRTRAVFEDGSAHVVVTTYGVLRRDFETLKEVEFETVVLDEAQIVKNEFSQAAKASRLLRAEHRLALSGTPIENHLGELWSLFEFLNPKMLGRLVRSAKETPESETALLARAVRPFILRRTKEQVLRELPAKNEQTLVCPLEGRQKELYDELKLHYQRALAEHVRETSLSGSKMWVIEALLRLRQAACHPDLLERSGTLSGSAKLDVLLPKLEEVLSEGHKALVFSQFTTFLGIVRRLLDERELSYEYLDGKTRDRGRRVERFQTDPGCGLFLVSLKAGGLGLNLTAADYVFILDPWWNPAAEAQAIDRAHRIGQTRPVFAYRLIAENTVEEKILELQRRKRDLAEAILVQDQALLRNLTAEDLELLLS